MCSISCQCGDETPMALMTVAACLNDRGLRQRGVSTKACTQQSPHQQPKAAAASQYFSHSAMCLVLLTAMQSIVPLLLKRAVVLDDIKGWINARCWFCVSSKASVSQATLRNFTVRCHGTTKESRLLSALRFGSMR